MITHLNIQNFKSWENTGLVNTASLTGFFGTNSSGKTGILQMLLLLKQTVESSDRQRILHTGDDKTYVDLGVFYDVIHQHKLPGKLHFSLGWKLPESIRVFDPEEKNQILFEIDEIDFSTTIEGTANQISVAEFVYKFQANGQQYQFGMSQKKRSAAPNEYQLIMEGYTIRRALGRKWPVRQTIKNYGFPDQVYAYFQNAGFLSQLVLAFEQLFQRVYYLGPLREYPHRRYTWSGEPPQDVGRRGELAVPALLASSSQGKTISRGKRKSRQTIEERVAEWLRDLGLIHSFSLQPIAENRKEYEVRVRQSAKASEVLITDVGFGVSQILPVLVLCYYAPPGSTLIFEQPEIHLHPFVQAGLADVFIDVIKTRNIQIVLESHSEHLLRRLQRRIAEEQLSANQAALYFISMGDGESEISRLQIDLFGNITNWPSRFFGDEMGDLVAMTEAAMKRQMATGG